MRKEPQILCCVLQFRHALFSIVAHYVGEVRPCLNSSAGAFRSKNVGEENCGAIAPCERNGTLQSVLRLRRKISC